jgi:hypothetical protein
LLAGKLGGDAPFGGVYEVRTRAYAIVYVVTASAAGWTFFGSGITAEGGYTALALYLASAVWAGGACLMDPTHSVNCALQAVGGPITWIVKMCSAWADGCELVAKVSSTRLELDAVPSQKYLAQQSTTTSTSNSGHGRDGGHTGGGSVSGLG